MPSLKNALVALCLLTAVAGAQHFVTDIPGTFVDLSTTGTSTLIATTDDSGHSFVSTVGNAMFPAGNLRLGNNGALVNTGATVTTGTPSLTNATIASGTNTVPTGLGTTASIVAALCPFWDDLDTLTAGGTEVRWEEIGGNLYVMWKNESHYPDAAGATITFEIIVYGGASGACVPYVQFIYVDSAFGAPHTAFDNGASATIGYVAAAALGGVLKNSLWSFNQPVAQIAVTSGMVLSLVEGPTTAFGVTLSSPGGPGTVQVDFTAPNPTCFSAFPVTYFFPVTFVDQQPKWFYGLGTTFNDLVAQFTAGYPYVGPAPSTIGPIPGVPPITVWFTAVGWPSGGPASPIYTTAGGSYTIP
jgi:hypothetical protein